MSLVPSLLQAILKVDGEALVMHAGEKPYVVAPAGQIELASRGLTLEAVDGIVGQLLPTELQRALDEFGAVQYELPAAPEFPREHFTVVAARGGDDLWVEIRRRRVCRCARAELPASPHAPRLISRDSCASHACPASICVSLPGPSRRPDKLVRTSCRRSSSCPRIPASRSRSSTWRRPSASTPTAPSRYPQTC